MVNAINEPDGRDTRRFWIFESIKVGTRPKVTILTTGSEVVEISETPGTDQIRNSNSAMLDVARAECRWRRPRSFPDAPTISKDQNVIKYRSCIVGHGCDHRRRIGWKV